MKKFEQLRLPTEKTLTQSEASTPTRLFRGTSVSSRMDVFDMSKTPSVPKTSFYAPETYTLFLLVIVVFLDVV